MSPPERPWRCFVAVPIGEELREAVGSCSAALQRRPEGRDWRWTDAGAWHVTLAFMGATDAATVPRTAAALSEMAAGWSSFTLEAGGLGAFSSASHARTLWYGIADPNGRLRQLAVAVQQAVGMEPEGRFRGHLTLARLRSGHQTDASQLLAAAAAPTRPLVVDRVVLHRSHLGRGPARYEELSVASLNGGSA